MIKILIVDDEKITRDSLKQFIPWTELGISTVETAKNGIVALALAKEMKPDIILCDIRMPKMNGIEFVTKVREFDCNCKVIFLSAFADKEYLKSAINLKAVSYIEKPILMEELTAVLKTTVSLCMEELEKKAASEILESRIIQILPYIREKIAMELINGTTSIELLKQKYGVSVSELATSETFIPISIILNWKYEIDQEERTSHEHNLMHYLYNQTLISSKSFVAGLVNNECIAFILYGEYILGDQYEYSLLEELLKLLLSFPEGEFTTTIGVGAGVKSLDQIPVSYQEANKAALSQFYFGTNKILFYKDIHGTHIAIDKNNYSDFKKLLSNDHISEACDLVKEITDELMVSLDPDFNYVKNIYFKLLLIILEVSQERKLLNIKVEDESKYIWQELAIINTLSELSKYLLSNIVLIFQKDKRDNILSSKIYEIITYIQANYNDRGLSVKSIANHVYLSHTYLCALFKKVTSKTLNEYITEVRIDKAKELLKNTNCKLYEITINIGLMDANYFSSIFKKYTGVAPTEFRERYHNDKNNSKTIK